MIYEKIIRLAVNREVKIVVRGQSANREKQVTIELDFFIRDGLNQAFYSLIGVDHPQYWKFRKYPSEKSQFLQLEYSGVSRNQLNDIIADFKRQYDLGFVFVFKADIGKRIKHLKGIRVSALSIRMLAAGSSEIYI